MPYSDIDWPYENSRRYYPFSTVNSVPTQLLLDLRLNATVNLPTNSTEDGVTYISKIVTDGVDVRFYLSADLAGASTTIDFGCIATANISQPVGSRVNINYVGQDNGIIFEGYLIIGDLSVLANMPPVTELGATTGALNTICINPMTNWIAGLTVNGQTYGGVVTLVAGPGVTITPDGNTLLITCTGAIPIANTLIQSDEDILREITNDFGVPITSINGEAITSGGEWTIITKESEGLSVDPDNDTHSITISNGNAAACCTQDDIAVLVDNIEALNQRAGILQSFQTQLETNLNILSAQVSRIL